MGKCIFGFRIGTLFHTPHGSFRNGSEPTKDQAKHLKEQGYKLESTKATEESAPAIFSDMRSDQIEKDDQAREQANVLADEVARTAAATHAGTIATTASVTGESDEETDAHQGDGGAASTTQTQE